MGAYSKFRAKPTVCEAGHAHASKSEAARCGVLTDLETNGTITHLEQQPTFKVAFDGRPICTYIADFRYRMVDSGLLIVEDVKGVCTPVFNLKRKLVEAAYPGTVISIYPPKARKKRRAKAAA